MLWDKNKGKKNDVMRLLVILLMNSSYGEITREDIEESFACKSEIWMLSEYDKRVKDFWKKSHGNYIVKMFDDIGLEDDVKRYLPYHFT